ncbi:2037_t:CDS:2 [Ambispora gerdemannii]|uniref:Autophagy-related protein 101 n=1 Tax=Ambispora gerdemannii TaxID=144530 RepID=A0A9N8V700_9GLOM|nr:2037_t:CDS:2 [Ambispora gerdemannii]
MNPEVFPIDLTVDKSMVKDVLRALLHTVLFYRVFLNIKPREVDLLELTYVSIDDFLLNTFSILEKAAIDDPEIEKEVEEKVMQFVHMMESHGNQKGQIAIMFHEKRTKKAWFSKSEEEICWEQWALTIHTVMCRTEMGNIIRFVNEKKDHIPSITEHNRNPFPYQIVIATTYDSWGSMLKRIL